jgi:hypothetical protein
MTIGGNRKDERAAFVGGKRDPGRPRNGERIEPAPMIRDSMEDERSVAEIGHIDGVFGRDGPQLGLRPPGNVQEGHRENVEAHDAEL